MSLLTSAAAMLLMMCLVVRGDDRPQAVMVSSNGALVNFTQSFFLANTNAAWRALSNYFRAGANITLTIDHDKISIAGTGGAPAGSNYWVQFSSNGTFSADSEFQWDPTTHRMGVSDFGIYQDNGLGEVSGRAGLVFTNVAGGGFYIGKHGEVSFFGDSAVFAYDDRSLGHGHRWALYAASGFSYFYSVGGIGNAVSINETGQMSLGRMAGSAASGISVDGAVSTTTVDVDTYGGDVSLVPGGVDLVICRTAGGTVTLPGADLVTQDLSDGTGMGPTVTVLLTAVGNVTVQDEDGLNVNGGGTDTVSCAGVPVSARYKAVWIGGIQADAQWYRVP